MLARFRRGPLFPRWCRLAPHFVAREFDVLLPAGPETPGSHRVGVVDLLYRDPETLEAVEYYYKVPSDISERDVLVVDPMLATGHSAAHAIDVLRRHGVSNQNIRFMALVAAPEGMKVVEDAHPGVHVYAAALDERLDENAYIVPGLGDAGDRLFGTK